MKVNIQTRTEIRNFLNDISFNYNIADKIFTINTPIILVEFVYKQENDSDKLCCYKFLVFKEKKIKTFCKFGPKEYGEHYLLIEELTNDEFVNYMQDFMGRLTEMYIKYEDIDA